MKKLTLTLTSILAAVIMFAQPPQAFKYQAVVRDAAGEILQDQNIDIRISIHDVTVGGTIIYQETFSDTTNNFGLVNLEIGTGTPTIGTFSGIDWRNSSKFLEIEIDPIGDGTYVSIGTSELLSVPYALYSESSGDTGIWGENADTIYYDDGYVGIGTSSPGAVLDIAGHIWQTGTGKSVFVGEGAGANDDLINNKNVFIGYNAGNTNTTGIHNTASGYNSLFNNTSGGRNTANGAYSLEQNTTGDYNIAIGTFALRKNTEGDYNTANGNSALTNNTTGNSNTASGCQSGYSNTSGYSYSFLGHNSGYSNTEGYSNAFIGSESGFSNTIGYINSFFGFQSGYNNTEGAGNTFIGNKNGFQNTTGGLNTFIGDRCGYKNTTGDYNTYLGYKSGFTNSTGSDNVSIGYKTLYFNVGNGNTANGFMALYNNTTGHSNIAIGVGALYSNTEPSNLVAIGDSALFNNGINPFFDDDAAANTALGSKVLFTNTNGRENTASGYQSLFSNTDGSLNTSSGALSLYNNTTGYGNTAIGCETLFSNTGGKFNIALGFMAFHNGSDYQNSTAIGYNAQPGDHNRMMHGNSSIYWIGGFSEWYYVSDARMKNNIKEDVKGLDFILELRPVTYNFDIDKMNDLIGVVDSSDYAEKYDKEKITQSGFLAQEVEQAAQNSGYDFSGVCAPRGDVNYYSMAYANFVVPLVKGMQEQQEMIDQLKKENTELKQQMNEQNILLLQRIEKLENNK